jgi:hypothetical protein
VGNDLLLGPALLHANAYIQYYNVCDSAVIYSN